MDVAGHREVRRLQGTTASPGIALGRVHCLVDAPAPTDTAPTNPRSESVRLERALDTAAAQLALMAEQLGEQRDAASMLEFQLAMIEDDTLRQAAAARIAEGDTAHNAWVAVLDTEIDDYTASDDEYFRARAADLIDIRGRVCGVLLGRADVAIPEGCVVVAEDLTPSQFLSTRWGQGGLALTAGSATSHVAMLARARGVPMVVRLESVPQADGGEAILDAHTGELIVGASPAEHRLLLSRRREDEKQRRREAAFQHLPAVTAGGESVRVLVNLADPEDVDQFDPENCDGAGLVRTELLFHRSTTLPGEDEQFQVYRRFVEWARGKPVTIRTLDAGGDKPIPGVTLDGEHNPFLGMRGIRLSLQKPDMFRVQLRALLRAAACGTVKIMLPMVTAPEEIAQVRVIVADERRALLHRGIEAGDPPLGMMVEVPSAAIAVDTFDADFFSIGSNDLVQYVTACSRDAAHLQSLARPDSTAVLRLIEAVSRHGHDTGREVSICGEMAGDPRYIGLLLERGLRSLSVAPELVAATKYAVINCP